MQRKLLKTDGTEYLANPHQDWMGWDSGRNTQVVILDTEDWAVSGSWGKKEDYPFTLADGTEVTVPGAYVQRKSFMGEQPYVLARNVKNGSVILVAPREVRGLWAEVYPQVEEAKRKRQEAAEAERKARDEREELFDNLAEEFERVVGFKPRGSSREGEFVLRLDEMQTLLGSVRPA